MILDSNVIIYSNQPGYEQLLAWLRRPTVYISVSAISTIEVLGYHRITDRDKADFETFFANVDILPVTSDIANRAIQLRQQRKRSLGDAVIAATGLIHNQPIVTNNVADSSTVDGLTVISLATILADS